MVLEDVHIIGLAEDERQSACGGALRHALVHVRTDGSVQVNCCGGVRGGEFWTVVELSGGEGGPGVVLVPTVAVEAYGPAAAAGDVDCPLQHAVAEESLGQRPGDGGEHSLRQGGFGDEVVLCENEVDPVRQGFG